MRRDVFTNFQISFSYIFSPFQAIWNIFNFYYLPKHFRGVPGGKLQNLILTNFLAISGNLEHF